MKNSARKAFTLLIIGLFSLVGMGAVYYSTTWGPWAFSDSAGYIAAARNLLAGHGLGYPAPSGSIVPLTIHPPLFSFVLSAMGLMGLDLIDAARWLNIFLFGATIFISGAFTYHLFRSAWFSIALSSILLTMPNLVDVSSGAMTEPLFLFTSALGILLLMFYLKNRKQSLLILSSISTGFALLSRYQGAVLVAIGIIVLLIAAQMSWRRRILDVVEFGLISTIPTAILLIWIYSLMRAQGTGDVHLPTNIWMGTVEVRRSFMEIFWNWLPFQELLPTYSYKLSRNIFILLVGLIVLLVGFVGIKILKSYKSTQNANLDFTFASIWVVFIFGNFLFISVAYIFSSLLESLYPRAFLPVQFGLVFALLALLLSLTNKYQLPPAFGWACVSLVLIFNVSYARMSWDIIQQYHANGSGYTSKAWHESTTIQALRSLPANIPLISNQSAAVLLLAGRPAYDFCTLPCNQSDQTRYGDNPQDPVQQVFREDGAALVFFYPSCGVKNQAWYSDTMSQLQSLTRNLTHYFSSCDGEIYYYPSTGQN